MRILLTGATSFTGAHIARALADAGHEVIATVTGRLVNYSDPILQRRRELAKVHDWIEEAPFGSPALLAALTKKKVDVFINHGADIRGYRKADFDYLASVRTGLTGAKEIMDALAGAGCRLFLHSGSIFEPGEGEWDAGATDPKRAGTNAVSIYGVSKAMVWEPLRFFAHRAGLNVSKVIIPNPIGPLENEDRLVPFFVRTWRAGGTPSLRTPQLARDNIPAQWLAKFYVDEVKINTVPPPESARTRIRRPSGFAMSNEAFLRLLIKQFEQRTGRSLPIEITPQASDEPPHRLNLEQCPERKDPAAEKKFWDEWFTSLGAW